MKPAITAISITALILSTLALGVWLFTEQPSPTTTEFQREADQNSRDIEALEERLKGSGNDE